MSLPDIQLHLSLSFCWHAGLSYGTRSSPQMKTSNMNLRLLTTVTNSKATKRWGVEEGVNYYSLRFSHTCKPSHVLLTHVTKPTPKLLVTKSCADPGIFKGGGMCPGSMPDGEKWTTYFFFIFFFSSTYFTVYRGGPMVLLQRKLYFSKDPEGV